MAALVAAATTAPPRPFPHQRLLLGAAGRHHPGRRPLPAHQRPPPAARLVLPRPRGLEQPAFDFEALGGERPLYWLSSSDFIQIASNRHSIAAKRSICSRYRANVQASIIRKKQTRATQNAHLH